MRKTNFLFSTAIKKAIFALAFLSAILFFNPLSVQATEAYTVTPATAVLYSGAGAEIYYQPDFGTYYTSINGNLPVNVTGVTSNGFFQVNIAGKNYYIYKTALATCKGTTAYKFSTFDSAAFVVGDAATGQLYASKAATTPAEPASTTKMLTAMLTIEAMGQGKLALDTPVIVSQSALASLPSDASHMNPKLKAGEIITVGSLLQACLISSDCQACNVLAEAVAGSVPAFVQLMNARAVQLGCTNTHFSNPSGYPDPANYTTAYSLFLIARQAMNYPVFAAIVNSPAAIIPATNLTPARTIQNTNGLINNQSGYYNPKCIGIKTGTANRAGYCLVSAATENGKTVISVVLGGRKRLMSDGSYCYGQYWDSNRLLDYGLRQ